ncbi:MAG: hypothetical protein AB7O98_10720 [Hyphomonadaceae bacterium]
MTLHPAPISPQPLARLNAWAKLWLIWLGGLAAQLFSNDWRARDLDSAAKIVGKLLMIKTAMHVRAKRTPKRYGRLKDYILRTILGSRVRRALRGRSFATRFFAILAVMRDLDQHVARLVRRLRNGLTRLHIIDPLTVSEACAHLCTREPALSDSS